MKLSLFSRIAIATASRWSFAVAATLRSKSRRQPIAITHAKIFTLAGAPIDDGVLVIKDGKIAAVGTNVDVPTGAQVIDGKGLQVYPGLFDPVTQIGLSEISAVSATVDTTETGTINPDAVAADAVLPSSEHIPVTRAAGITEVLAVPASGGFDSRGSANLLGGQASAIHLAGWTINDMLIKKSVAMVIDWPTIDTESFDFTTFYAQTKAIHRSQAGIRQASRSNSPTGSTTRATTRIAWGHGGPAEYQRDLKLEALVPVIRGELPVLVFASRAREIRNAVEFCDKQKIKMILAGGAEVYKVKDLLRSKNIPVILQPTLTEPLDEDDPYDRSMTDRGRTRRRSRQIRVRQLRQFVRAPPRSTGCQRRRARPSPTTKR